MADLTVEEVKAAVYKDVADVQGKKKLKPMDLQKMVFERFGDRADKRECKKITKLAIRQLIESGECVYSYFGGSYVELPPPEGENR
jgi:hypothetical protein